MKTTNLRVSVGIAAVLLLVESSMTKAGCFIGVDDSTQTCGGTSSSATCPDCTSIAYDPPHPQKIGNAGPDDCGSTDGMLHKVKVYKVTKKFTKHCNDGLCVTPILNVATDDSGATCDQFEATGSDCGECGGA